MIRDRLVAPRTPEAREYLRAGRAVLPVQLQEEVARDSWLRAERRYDELDGFHGSDERRKRTAKTYDERRHELTIARRAERRAKTAAEQADPASAASVEGELLAVWCDYHDRRNERG
jgi:hypothetical protein